MKLYLSSKGIPRPDELAVLLGKSLDAATVSLIPNSKDCYAERARGCFIKDTTTYMEQLGLRVEVVDLRDYDTADALRQDLAGHDLIWAMGGNTFNLRYEMKRSGFEEALRTLLDEGVVYGGDSAGALVAGRSIAGIESADRPEFAEAVLEEGMNLVPYCVLPHADGPSFASVVPVFRDIHRDGDVIELKDSQAVVFDGDAYRIVE